MSLLDPEPIRPGFTQENTPEGVRVIVPAVKNRYVLAGVPVLLVWWMWAEWEFAQDFWSGADRGLGSLIWLVLIPIVAAGCFRFWMWTLLGREVFLMRPDALEVRCCVLGLTWSNTFPWDEICSVRFRPERSHILDPLSFQWSALLVEHGGRSHVFARDLESPEIDQMIALMQQHMPLQPAGGEQLFRSL